jgi:hypothetical protein
MNGRRCRLMADLLPNTELHAAVRGNTIKQLELVAGTALERDRPTAEPIKTSVEAR